LNSASRSKVVKPFIDEYLAGRTPIPCTLCNNFIKFDQFLEMAAGVGPERIATGHYAQLRWNPDNGRWEMLRSVDRTKDQTYFLCGLKQDQLARTEFPLGGFEKSQVREFARELGIPTAAKPDSQEICFVPERRLRGVYRFILSRARNFSDRNAGELVTTDGHVVGEHAGRASFHGRATPRVEAGCGRAAVRDLDRARHTTRGRRTRRGIAARFDAREGR
jgi:tRNA-specific 2-thiouridylase